MGELGLNGEWAVGWDELEDEMKLMYMIIAAYLMVIVLFLLITLSVS
jgi:hypothetical protein